MGFYNNPAFGEAANNIAKMFAPPNSGDVLNYANARAKQAQAARLAQLFAEATTPEQRQIAADLYDPSNSFTAVEMNNTAAAQRNAADNVRALADRKLQEQGLITRQFAEPVLVNEGQTAFLPQPTAAATGLAPVLRGATAAPSMTQWEAQQAERLRAGGQLSDADIYAKTMGDTPVEMTIGMDGTPQYIRRANSEGKPAYVNKGAEAAPKLGSAKVNGVDVSVTLGPDGKWRTTQSNQIIPDSQVFDMPNMTGTPGEFDPTKTNVTRGQELNATIASIDAHLNGFEKLLAANPGIMGAPGKVRGITQNAAQSLKEITTAFGDKAPDAALTLDEIRSGLEQFAPGYDPAIQEAMSTATGLAYRMARFRNSNGEVSRRAFETALDEVIGGATGNNARTLTTIGSMRKELDYGRVEADNLLNPKGPGEVGVQPSAPTAAVPRAINPVTKEVLELRNGAWVPAQ